MRILSKSSSILLGIVLLTVSLAAQTQQPQTADENDRAGFAAQQAKKFEEALQLYAAAIKLNQKDWIARANSGFCSATLGV